MLLQWYEKSCGEIIVLKTKQGPVHWKYWMIGYLVFENKKYCKHFCTAYLDHFCSHFDISSQHTQNSLSLNRWRKCRDIANITALCFFLKKQDHCQERPFVPAMFTLHRNLPTKCVCRDLWNVCIICQFLTYFLHNGMCAGLPGSQCKNEEPGVDRGIIIIHFEGLSFYQYARDQTAIFMLSPFPLPPFCLPNVSLPPIPLPLPTFLLPPFYLPTFPLPSFCLPLFPLPSFCLPPSLFLFSVFLLSLFLSF